METGTTILGDYNGGRSASDTGFEFFVQEPGLYLFRLLYQEGMIGSTLEWWNTDLNGDLLEPVRVLVNDSRSAGAIKSFLPTTEPPCILQEIRDSRLRTVMQRNFFSRLWVRRPLVSNGASRIKACSMKREPRCGLKNVGVAAAAA